MKTVGWNPPEHSKTLFHISKTGHPPHSSPCILHRLVYAVNLNGNCVGDLGALAMADLLASMSAGFGCNSRERNLSSAMYTVYMSCRSDSRLEHGL